MMLAKENSGEFMATLKQVLDQIKVNPASDEDLDNVDDENEKFEDFMKIAQQKIAYEK
jgi:CRISPR/Cas system CSM-associated protein Csm2 small subunit